jgi:DNA polymerase I-like protein with 3'-5' exonuclease and polymerase domains
MSKVKSSPNQAPFDFMVPASEWVTPTELPDLSGQHISLDLETRDDGLAANRGAGWATGAGYIVGVAVGWSGGASYIPVRHPDTDNFDRGAVVAWVGGLLRGARSVVFQNGGYDLGWLKADFGLDAPLAMEDTHAASVMLDENRLSYKLDALCAWQGLPGKDNKLLMEAGQALGLGATTNAVMGNLWRLPARFVGAYAEGDAAITLDLFERLRPQLDQQEVWEAYKTEIEIMPLCMEMRRRGIRIDTSRAEAARGELRGVRDAALREVGTYYREGRDPDINDVLSPIWLGRAFTDAGVSYPRTPKSGQGSFQTDWLEKHPHPLARAVNRARYYQMISDKFLRGFLLDYCHRGRLHAEVNQLRDDDGGTRSHRFSYSDPPLQQMPSPKRGSTEAKAAGKLIRSCFLPEEGEEWVSNDFHSQEFRLMVHFASLLRLPKADEAVAKYKADPLTDFHTMVAEMTGLPRPEAKDVNFAKAFGAGVKRFSEMTGRSMDDSKRIMDWYDEELPFIKGESDKCKKAAESRGYVRLIDGARCRFDLWEPGWGYEGKYHAPCGHEEARARAAEGSGHSWAGAKLRRSYTHKAMNRLIQGSAARQTKIAMRDLWRQGIVPMLQMHDEINASGSKETGIIVQRTMEQAVKLTIPVKADLGVGPSWGELVG